MPIQIIISEGLLSKESAQSLHQDIGQVFLDTHELGKNAFMIPNVIGEVVFIDKELTFAGLKVSELAIIELRVPSFTFGSQEQKDSFVAKSTEIVFKYTKGSLPKERIWVNAVYAVDGLWGIAGKAYSNEQLGELLMQAS